MVLFLTDSSPKASIYPSVITCPGHTQFTSILYFFISAASDSVKLIKPALVILYAVLPAAPFLPPIAVSYTHLTLPTTPYV